LRVATIDIGTNTTLLLVADCSDDRVRVLCERAEITRLGRGIGADGGLGQQGIERTLAAIGDYAAIAAQQGASIHAIGTEALRRAPNARDFLDPAARILGAPVEVIDGEREAALTFLAAVHSFPQETQGTAVVIDIGGGSTEIIVAQNGRMEFRRSLPLGSVRLTEKFVHSDPATSAEVAAVVTEVDSLLASVPFPAEPGTLIGTAGTVTTVAAMALHLQSYDPARVHGYCLRRPELERQIDRLRTSTRADRDTMAGLDPKRADVILAGACILDRIALTAYADEILVSDRGIRWGLLIERVTATTGRAPALS
jgi:exopolyphosphatase / guanosine-5'-triphosphate,3'-diphosphate pyrophosphatase